MEKKQLTDSKAIQQANLTHKGFSARSKAELQELQRKSVEVRETNKKKRQTAKAVLQELLASNTCDKDAEKVLQEKNIQGTELASLLLHMTRRASKSANMAELVFRLTGDLEQAPQQTITIVNAMTDEQLLQERQRILGGGDCIDITPLPPDTDE